MSGKSTGLMDRTGREILVGDCIEDGSVEGVITQTSDPIAYRRVVEEVQGDFVVRCDDPDCPDVDSHVHGAYHLLRDLGEVTVIQNSNCGKARP